MDWWSDQSKLYNKITKFPLGSKQDLRFPRQKKNKKKKRMSYNNNNNNSRDSQTNSKSLSINDSNNKGLSMDYDNTTNEMKNKKRKKIAIEDKADAIREIVNERDTVENIALKYNVTHRTVESWIMSAKLIFARAEGIIFIVIKLHILNFCAILCVCVCVCVWDLRHGFLLIFLFYFEKKNHKIKVLNLQFV